MTSEKIVKKSLRDRKEIAKATLKMVKISQRSCEAVEKNSQRIHERVGKKNFLLEILTEKNCFRCDNMQRKTMQNLV